MPPKVNLGALRALFFDLDGTLADSERDHWQCWRDVVSPLGVVLTWDEYRECAVGRSDDEIMQHLMSRTTRKVRAESADILAEKRRRFIQRIHRQSLVAQNTLELLNEIGELQLAVVSSSPRVEVAAMLDGAGIRHSFQAIVCLEDVGSPKPSPEPYLQAKEKLGVEFGVAFEDSAAGEASARAAGLEVVVVPHPRALPEMVRSILRR